MAFFPHNMLVIWLLLHASICIVFVRLHRFVSSLFAFFVDLFVFVCLFVTKGVQTKAKFENKALRHNAASHVERERGRVDHQRIMLICLDFVGFCARPAGAA